MELEDMIVSSLSSKKIKIDFVGQGNETQEKKFSTAQHMQRTVFSLPPFLPCSSPHHPLILTSSSPHHHLLITSPERPRALLERPGALPERPGALRETSGRAESYPSSTPLRGGGPGRLGSDICAIRSLTSHVCIAFFQTFGLRDVRESRILPLLYSNPGKYTHMAAPVWGRNTHLPL